MSSEAVGWVYRHSPYRGSVFALHHAIADSANDQNGFEVWLGNAKLASKTRIVVRSVISGLTVLIDGGFLELVDSQHGRAGSATYRMLFPEVPVVYDSREGRRTRAVVAPVQSTTSAIDDANGCNPQRQLVQSTKTTLLIELKEPKEPKASPSAPKSDPVFEALCEIDHIDWNKATPRELGRTRKARSGLAVVEATAEDVQTVATAMATAGWKPSMITSTSIEANFSKFHTTEQKRSRRPAACDRCGTTNAGECSVFDDCPRRQR